MLHTHRHRLSMLQSWAAHDVNTFTALSRTVARHGVNLKAARVLDIGCGANAPMTLMLKGSGASVTGIDYEIGHRWGLGFRPSRYRAYARQVGVGKTLRKALGELV